MEEIWKDIEEVKGKYQVSNLGNIKSLSRNKKMVLTQDKDGYLEIFMWKNKKKVHYRVHRLVAKAFIPNMENKAEVNHKNGIKSDNRVCNLEWVTKNENERHAYAIGLKHGMIGKDNPNSKSVIKYDLKMNKIATYVTIKEAGIKNNICAKSIGKCCNGKIKTSGGYIWKYA